ncbi:MAG: 30S ribosomal protein S12 methylthiotransferase RimO [candidate division Zixibacteria bacterium HGW-Zixibacteria-1]|nr:MAG: 30S ribosomal protein S12 methylthiotransferase RimO [candidate division Zixibacteria bacterium HGW-Zixibacteria-1]
MKFYIKKLGCPKNDVDGDYIAGMLISRGLQPTNNDLEADIVIVNTCGFILPAKEESINEILNYEQQKERGQIKKLYVTGCLPQRYGDELTADMPLIDGFFGLGKIEALADAIIGNNAGGPILVRDKASELTYLSGGLRHVDTARPYDYVKIADGCDRYCSYCAIPLIRGRYRSRPMSEIIDETQMLASKGKKEIILVSQEGTGYGRDFDKGPDIPALLRKLEEVEGIEWIRLMYLHPEAVTEELIDFMTFSGKVLGYFDIPLQHINDRILSSMNRRTNRSEIENTLYKIRDKSADNIIRTTFITGFPEETEKEFGELKRFIEEFKFDRLGVFKYSSEEGTRAAGMKNQISDAVAEARQDVLMSVQQEIAFDKNIALIDKIQQVIIDEVKPDAQAVGRTKGDCPEIDQQVYIDGENLTVGDILEARVVMAEGYDLIAKAEVSGK